MQSAVDPNEKQQSTDDPFPPGVTTAERSPRQGVPNLECVPHQCQADGLSVDSRVPTVFETLTLLMPSLTDGAGVCEHSEHLEEHHSLPMAHSF